MQVQIHSIHFDADQSLISFIENKVAKLNTFHDKIINSDVYLKIEKNNTRENKVAEVKIHAPGVEFFAKRRAVSFEASVDEALEAIRRQISKQKKD
jgi:putative sigma-54 modulation protein